MKSGTTPTGQQKLLNRATRSPKTSKCSNKRLFLQVCSSMWATHLSTICYWLKGREGILKVIFTQPWIIFRHLNDMSSNSSRLRQSIKHNIFDSSLVTANQFAISRQRGQRETRSLHYRQVTTKTSRKLLPSPGKGPLMEVRHRNVLCSISRGTSATASTRSTSYNGTGTCHGAAWWNCTHTLHTTLWTGTGKKSDKEQCRMNLNDIPKYSIFHTSKKY